ncbi:conserved membrane hypothetical protein [Imperialibacter sp. EC-SDR9]|nr:conserved membrane hypothetical protein [Imperialibacter sp. 89]CAD5260658.1 conserved membrane hypothetical protein [Imperialibacter sp. 75]VVT04059.1 conserved membrane hypothetical protein [Imperialibacter sp. EC-SDR9]
MKQTQNHQLIALQQRYLMLRLLEVLCLSAGVGLILMVVGKVAGLNPIDALVLAGTVGLLVLLQRIYGLGLHQLSPARLASFINRQYPDLNWSADLLATDQPLSGLQQLQRERALVKIMELSKLRFPHQLWVASLVLLAGISLLIFFPGVPIGVGSGQSAAGNSPTTASAESAFQPVVLESIEGTINAPAYTGLRTVSFADPNIKAVEGSVVSWELGFSLAPQQALIIFSGSDTLALEKRQSMLSCSAKVFNTGFYQVAWQQDGEWKASDFYKLEVAADLPPQLAIRDLPQFQQFEWNDVQKINVKTDLSDDYGLKDAYLIATVAKGSGESVKFREEKLLFDKPQTISGKKVVAERIIDLKKMGLEPGDELYFYVEAWDNKAPKQQTERTETYFLQLKDTVSYIVSNDGGLGVDLMPEYFRSQRQIIIDSEKLVADRGKIKKEIFDNTSNGLGHDQKVLRLRYGQFLGEEFESGITETEAHEPEEVAAPTNTDEAMKQFGHAHDTENEHNLVPQEDHEHSGEEEENPLEAFAHMHDSEEEATFYIQSVKAKLRAALSMMWDAELHLRMNNPEESLPYQYKILKLLKEISNDSRIYVHRTGFDPPPIKEEKRLTGDLTEINPARRKYLLESRKSFPNSRKALVLLEKYMQQPAATPTDDEKDVLQLAGNELAGQAIEFPGRYLESMSLIKALIDDDFMQNKIALLKIRKALWEIVPNEPASPALHPTAASAIDQQFLKRMEANE